MYFPMCLHQTQLQPMPHNDHVHNQSQYSHQRLKHDLYVAFATFHRNIASPFALPRRHAEQRPAHNDEAHQIHAHHSHLN
jgi:hypothetical protein